MAESKVKKYYRLSPAHEKFSRLEKIDLELDDVFITKEEETVKEDTAYVVASINPFAYMPLSRALNLISAVAKKYGVYIYPSEFPIYFEKNDISNVDEEMLDNNWGIISCRHDCEKWYRSLKENESNIYDLVSKI